MSCVSSSSTCSNNSSLSRYLSNIFVSSLVGPSTCWFTIVTKSCKSIYPHITYLLLVVHQLFDGTSNLLQTSQPYFTPFWNILTRHTQRYGNKHDFKIGPKIPLLITRNKTITQDFHSRVNMINIVSPLFKAFWLTTTLLRCWSYRLLLLKGHGPI